MINVVTAGLVAALLAPQANQGTAMLAKHIATLQEAKSLTATFTVQQLPAAAKEYSIAFDRSGAAKLTTPDGFMITDGKTVWDYTKASNEYVERPGGIKELLDTLKSKEFVVWAGFYFPELYKGVSATAEAKTNLRGTVVTPLSLKIDDRGVQTARFFFDEKLGLARGANFKTAKNNDSVEILVIAKEVTVGATPLDAALFEFVAPEGAKKVQVSAADMAKWYTNLDEALGVAKATNRMVYVDFGAEW